MKLTNKNPESGWRQALRSEMKYVEKRSADSLPPAGRYFGAVGAECSGKSPRADNAEYSYWNAWNMNNNGNVNNNNNKNNNNRARAVQALTATSSNLTCPSLFYQNASGKMQLADLFEAYYECRKNKRNTLNAIAFEIDYEHNLIELCDEINRGEYVISRSIAFIVKQPVQREIFAADFRDCIIHHYIIACLEPLFEKLFIGDSYSCRKEKGTLYGVRRIAYFIDECSAHYTQDAYILKLDIEGFFMHIDKPLLNRKLHDFLEEQYFGHDKLLVMQLCRQIIDKDPTRDCIIKGRRSDWYGLPKSKSLFGVGRDKGLPIGNLSSQMFANFYLDALDKFIIHTLGIKYYGRYVDDFVIVHRDKEYLKSIIPKIDAFLKRELLLRLHPKKIYLQHYAKGVKYIGAVIKPQRLYIANRTKGNCWQAIERHNAVVNNHRPSKDEIKAFQASINSYFGIMGNYRTYNIKKRMKNHFSGYWWNHIQIKKGYIALRGLPVKYPSACGQFYARRRNTKLTGTSPVQSLHLSIQVKINN